MTFDKNIGGHAFPERGGTCVHCGMTWTAYVDKGTANYQRACPGKKPEAHDRMFIDEGDDGKIYADASQPATLRHGGSSVECLTLQEAVIAWRRLPAADQAQATIKVNIRGGDGPLYTAHEIERLHHKAR